MPLHKIILILDFQFEAFKQKNHFKLRSVSTSSLSMCVLQSAVQIAFAMVLSPHAKHKSSSRNKSEMCRTYVD